MPRIRQSDGAAKGHPRVPSELYGTKSEAGSQVLNEAQLIQRKYKTSATTAPPSIPVQPTSRSVSAGSSTTFTVTATGTGPLTYQWKKNGINVGSNSASYSYTPSSMAESGAQVWVVVTSAYGSVTSSYATLTVTAPAAPTISSPTVPIGITINLNAANYGNTNDSTLYRMNVNASGGSLTYQWRRNGVDIPGATISTHYVTAYDGIGCPQTGDVYTCAVTNIGGTTVSAAITLTFTEVPGAATEVIETGLNFKKLVKGGDSTDPYYATFALVDVGGGQNGLYRSTDLGQTWSRIGDLAANYTDVVTGAVNHNLLASTADNRVLWSQNNGDTWTTRVAASANKVFLAKDTGGAYEVGYMAQTGSTSYDLYETTGYGASWSSRGSFSSSGKFSNVLGFSLCGDNILVTGDSGKMWLKVGAGATGSWVTTNVDSGVVCFVGHSASTPAPAVALAANRITASNRAKNAHEKTIILPDAALNSLSFTVRNYNISHLNTVLAGRFPVRFSPNSMCDSPSNAVYTRRWTGTAITDQDITAVVSYYNTSRGQYDYMYGTASGRLIIFKPTPSYFDTP